ncbi:G-type lectin S-receptor-like serine/threonine-protein kinase [Actinidia chinensis var. chinensis]|uniref:G-type lectin S-receptor-like serine/threonine-protein kinase n=1 Tax=Actinidia chinensis var. chinensis TaxID=1590841 RepID=A0A2R6QZ94_ACTCC|nr:G-type lectin S-receptor-like serine/threonine-protein kinase [Actinidia chinensis var. chinensis]
MKLYLFVFLIHLFTNGLCISDVHIGYKVILAVPMEYISGFTGRAFIMGTNQMVLNFRVGLSVESVEQKYSCSLDVFLGDLKVWSSGHFSRFYTTETCVLELTQNGDLQLKGQNEVVGWKTGTSAQGVQRLHLLRSGNLVLVDAFEQIKWQSFNFPTNIMLWGQRLNVKTHLTSFPANSTSFFSFEIQQDKIALYLNAGKLKYSYWEFKPSDNRNITFIQVGSKGLNLFGDKYTKIARIPSRRLEPLRFLALGNETGNLGLYYYSPDNAKFEASFLAINTTCDLPWACKPYGICTLSDVCSCIRFITRDGMNSGCSNGTSEKFCGKKNAEMVELTGVTTVLRGPLAKANVSKEKCGSLCLDDCNCVASLYSNLELECFVYGLVIGVKQVGWGSGLSYMVKVPKGSGGQNGKSSGLKKWVLVVVGVADGLIIVLVLGLLYYYVIHKGRKNLQDTDNTS